MTKPAFTFFNVCVEQRWSAGPLFGPEVSCDAYLRMTFLVKGGSSRTKEKVFSSSLRLVRYLQWLRNNRLMTVDQAVIAAEQARRVVTDSGLAHALNKESITVRWTAPVESHQIALAYTLGADFLREMVASIQGEADGA